MSVGDSMRLAYTAWLYGTPFAVGLSYWWWEKRRDAESRVSRSLVATGTAALPGVFLWMEHSIRSGMELAFGRPRSLEVYEYPTTMVGVSWILALPILVLISAICRPLFGGSFAANVVQARQVIWAVISWLVALWFAAAI
jgi:hypothetical protein